MRDFEIILKALANGRRLAIVKALKSKKELTVGEISTQIKLSFRSTSKHLAILLATRIVKKEQRSLSVFYSISGKLPFEQLTRHIIRLL